MQGQYKFIQEVPKTSRGWCDERDIVNNYSFSQRIVVCLEGRDNNGDLKFSPLYQSLPYSDVSHKLQELYGEVEGIKQDLYNDSDLSGGMFGIYIFTGIRFDRSAREDEFRQRTREKMKADGRVEISRVEAIDFYD